MRILARRARAALLVALIALPVFAQAQRVLGVDRIVAVVNKEVVTQTELNEQVATAERELRRQGTALPEPELLRRQVLERLIVLKAQLQLARDTGIRIDDTQLEATLERIAEGNRMSLAQFRRQIERDGVNFERFREEVREQIMLTRLREREVDAKIQVSESEIDLYLEENKGEQAGALEYNVAHILVRVPEQAGPEAISSAEGRARKAREEARAGADFARLAASYSDGPDALKGGVMGWRPADRMPELFVNGLNGVPEGGVSEVLRSPAGFHVLKLLGRRGGTAAGAPVTQTHVRHILVKTNEAVSEVEARRRLTDLRERIQRGGAKFAELARLHSEDPSAAQGGDIGWVYAGDTVPDFERAMDALKPGEVSEPVKSPFGFHLIEVIERRKAGLSAERRRLVARQALRERKSDEAFQEWLRQLRDQSYVELRLEPR